MLIVIETGLLAGIRWSVCMLISYRSLCVAFSRTGAGLYIYHLLVWSDLNFLRSFSLHENLVFFLEIFVTECLLRSRGLFEIYKLLFAGLWFGQSLLLISVSFYNYFFETVAISPSMIVIAVTCMLHML